MNVQIKRVYLAVADDRDRAERRLREWFAKRYRSANMGSRVSIWGTRTECIDKFASAARWSPPRTAVTRT